MKAIATHLQDPGWWFTAVVVGIAASLVAAFAKEYLEKRFGLFLGWTRARREQLKAEKEITVQAWSQNEGLITILFLKALFSIVILGAILISGLILVVYLRVEFGSDQIIPTHMILIASVVVALSFSGMWISSIEFATARDCFREFRKNRGLPALKGAKSW